MELTVWWHCVLSLSLLLDIWVWEPPVTPAVQPHVAHGAPSVPSLFSVLPTLLRFLVCVMAAGGTGVC